MTTQKEKTGLRYWASSREPLYPVAAQGLHDNAKQVSEDTHALTLVPVCSFGPSQLLQPVLPYGSLLAH